MFELTRLYFIRLQLGRLIAWIKVFRPGDGIPSWRSSIWVIFEIDANPVRSQNPFFRGGGEWVFVGFLGSDTAYNPNVTY